MRLKFGRPDIDDYRERFDLAEADPDGALSVTWLGVSTLLVDDGTSAVMTDGFFSGADLFGQGLQQVAKEASKINPVIDSQKTVIRHHEFDTLHVEGVNDEGEFVAAAD